MVFIVAPEVIGRSLSSGVDGEALSLNARSLQTPVNNVRFAGVGSSKVRLFMRGRSLELLESMFERAEEGTSAMEWG